MLRFEYQLFVSIHGDFSFNFLTPNYLKYTLKKIKKDLPSDVTRSHLVCRAPALSISLFYRRVFCPLGKAQCDLEWLWPAQLDFCGIAARNATLSQARGRVGVVKAGATYSDGGRSSAEQAGARPAPTHRLPHPKPAFKKFVSYIEDLQSQKEMVVSTEVTEEQNALLIN